ncbi:hypothetical protein [Glycomyces xiaoerkulensis]|uniref:hypothetical protein n=1 Tax=Glycomyces xiaoerkulensis TaxID=2038139 RepID=UPI0012FFD6BE|nr:hypothetical protein [Glycomyces xiaoerkulensis]
MVGGAVIVVLAIIMAVTLLIIQRTGGGGSDQAGDETTSEAEQTEEEEPSAEEPSEEPEPEPTEDEPTGEGGGNEEVGFNEQTCDQFDLSAFEEYFGSAHDAGQDYRYSSSSGDTGSLSCTYYTEEGYNELDLEVTSYSDADYAMDWYEGDYEYWDDDDSYEVSDYEELGDAGFHVVYGSEGSQKRGVEFVVGVLIIKVDIWIYTEEHDADAADEVVYDYAEEVVDLFSGYA